MTGSVVTLGPEDLIEDDVAPERASLLHAAARAPNVAMLTGTFGVVLPPLTRPDAKLPAPAALAPRRQPFEEREGESGLAGRLRARVECLEDTRDPIAAVRARLELARAHREAGDRAAALAQIEAAAAAIETPSAAVESARRDMRIGRLDTDAELACVTNLADAASDVRVRADFLAERGRLLTARDETSGAAAAHREALALAPDHAAATYGLEGALERAERWEELAEHLAMMAEASASVGSGASEAAAWLHVERALLLERRVEDEPAARVALLRALELAPGKGAVRDACVDHAVRHRDDAWLAVLLEAEATLEADAARAARLELDAALAHLRAGAETHRAVRLLERALSRAPTSAVVDRRVAAELVRIHDAEHRFSDALRVRKAALRIQSDPREELVALRAAATAAERAGAIDEAVLALERARVVESDDPTLLADLERVLELAGRHEQRAVAWVREAALVDAPERKARALLEAARAARKAGREAEAERHLQAAWLTAPSAPGVYDAVLSELPTAGAREAAEARVALYEQAVRSARDPDKRVYWLEKIAWLWDDVAGDPALAARAYEDVLAVEPARASAIAGLASTATRAGDDRRLARALLAEADVTADPEARAEVRLRAAEVMAGHDAERALAIATELAVDPHVGRRARALVTRMHLDAGRWEQAARSLAERGGEASDPKERVALAIAEAGIAMGRLGSPERALAALVEARKVAPDDAALSLATLEALEVLGEPLCVRRELESLAAATEDPERRCALFVRAAELDEAEVDGAERALRTYARALRASPRESLVVDRIVRLGARLPSAVESEHPDLLPAVRRAARALESESPGGTEALLALTEPTFATLRLAERIARRAGSAPQLANALALQVEVAPPPLAMRALAGVAELVTWTLPESDDLEPFDRLVERGSHDATVLDELVRRARRHLERGDGRLRALVAQALSRRLARAADDTERLVLGLELASVQRGGGAARAAALQCRTALGIEPMSVTAASWLAELAAETADVASAIAAATALAGLCTDAKVAAALLSDAADLELARGDAAAAASLLERALTAEPDAVLVAARLADVQTRRGAHGEVARVLRRALAEARSAEAVVPMASELAEIARERLRDPALAIEALERAREVAPAHVPSRLVLAELYIGQRVWSKALVVLGEVVERTEERAEKLVALTGRAAVFARGLGRPEDAEAELRAALELDAHDPRALRLLLDTSKGRMADEERATLLSRLALTEPIPERRRLTLLELADARRATGDTDGMEGALIEAAAISPDPAMLDRVRELTREDPQSFARVVTRAIARARDSGRATSPAWLARIGQIEADVLGRHDEAIEHLRDALEADPTRIELRPLLVRVLVSTGRNPEAATEAMPLFATPAGAAHLDGLTLRLVEAALTGSGRAAEAGVVRELRALVGATDARERASLSDVAGGFPSEANALAAPTLRALLPTLGRHPVWDVASVAVEMGGKLARVGLTEVGASSRERVKARAIHPLRAPFERALQVFGLRDVELAVSDGAARASVAVEDVPWVVLPAALAGQPDVAVSAALLRPMTLLALGVPWLDVLPAADVLGALVAVARQVAPSFASPASPAVEAAASDSELRARRATDRRRRKILEELRTAIEGAPPIPEAAFVAELARLSARLSFLVTGDLRAALGALAPAQAGLVDVLRGAPQPGVVASLASMPLARDLMAFALGGEASALRRRLGMRA